MMRENQGSRKFKFWRFDTVTESLPIQNSGKNALNVVAYSDYRVFYLVRGWIDLMVRATRPSCRGVDQGASKSH